MPDDLLEFLSAHPSIRGLPAAERVALSRSMEGEYLPGLLSRLVDEIEEVMAIDPNLDQKTILEIAAEKIVGNVKAEAASIRLFDPKSLKMAAFGSYRIPNEEREMTVPSEDSISGRVVRENRCIPVPSILEDPYYRNKKIVAQRGFYSLLGVPIRIPSFMTSADDLLGSLQIYYKEDHRDFTAFEIIHAEWLARRVSYVLAKKKILDLQKLNRCKEKIVDKIFVKLSRREGVKLKDLFILLIPEFSDFFQVQSCALYSVSPNQEYLNLIAAYPLDQTYHEPGYTFTVRHHPYFKTAIHGGEVYDDAPFERIDASYLLIKDPRRSRLTSPGMKAFAEAHQIHSILLVPLKVSEAMRYLMTFYARDHKQYFRDEEIEILTFFAKEIMKASRLELLDDLLHDLKNPAVAIAGFASRSRKLLDAPDLSAVRDRLASYLDIVVRETIRLQDLAFATSAEGREEVLDLSSVARDRFRLNEEAIHESRRRNIRVLPPQLEPDLRVYCPLFGLERVLDNLLSNASKAIPGQGGVLSIRSYREVDMACLEVRNTGKIPEDKIEQVRRGEVRGRGLNIIYRFTVANHGKVEVRTEAADTVFTVKLPIHRIEAARAAA